jgi:hypothetical protein
MEIHRQIVAMLGGTLIVFAIVMVLIALAHFIRRSLACGSKGGDEAVGWA